jgi:hypothetical protein
VGVAGAGDGGYGPAAVGGGFADAGSWMGGLALGLVSKGIWGGMYRGSHCRRRLRASSLLLMPLGVCGVVQLRGSVEGSCCYKVWR